MNGIEKISARILADAEAEAAAIRAQAEEKAAQIRAEYDRKLEDEQQHLTLEAQNEAQKQLERGQGAARMAARRQVLEKKQMLVDKAFRTAEQLLLSLPEADYTRLCAQLAAQASVTGSETLIFSEADRARAAERMKDAVVAETRPMRGGVVLKNGLVETNCSIGTLVDGLRPELSGKVAGRLFG